MNTFTILLTVFLFFCAFSFSSARDINLDEIYINKTSFYNHKLIDSKLDIYQKINSAFVDRDVSFAWWISGDEILYIKENISCNVNIVYRYKIYKNKSEELTRFTGAVTAARVNNNGKYIIIKRLIQKDNLIPEGQLLILDTGTCEITANPTPYAFLDFSIPNAGNTIIYEKKNKIVEYHLDIKRSFTLLEKASYADIIVSKNPSFALLSPDRNKILVINGNGGYYKCKLIDKDRTFNIDGLSSSSEIYWIDNDRLIYRKGSAGDFSVVMFHIKNKKEKMLLSRSFNTNITFTPHPMKAAFLREQIINIYDFRKNIIINTGIEGEDVSFSPNGNKFISLLYKKLFIIDTVTINKKTIELKRSWNDILSLYKGIKLNNHEFTNEYSFFYLTRKIDAYNDLINN